MLATVFVKSIFFLTRFHILIVLQHIQINGHQYFSFSLLRIDNTNSYIECTLAGDPLAEEVTTMNYGKNSVMAMGNGQLELDQRPLDPMTKTMQMVGRTMLLNALFLKDHSLTM